MTFGIVPYLGDFVGYEMIWLEYGWKFVSARMFSQKEARSLAGYILYK